MTNTFSDIRSTFGKAYLSCIMALLMVVLEVIMHDAQYKVVSTNMYIILALATSFFIYLYRKQVAIYDKQYLEEMIEHNSMALLTSEQILTKTNNYEVAKIAKNIIQKQKDEIREMNIVVEKL
jgi:Ca2+/Na+ antiporter